MKHSRNEWHRVAAESIPNTRPPSHPQNTNITSLWFYCDVCYVMLLEETLLNI